MDYGKMAPCLSDPSRPYDLHSAQIKKSDDLDNACAKSLVLEALLAQAVAMQIISTPGMSRARLVARRLHALVRRALPYCKHDTFIFSSTSGRSALVSPIKELQ
jgi:hypothetical protein